MGLFDFASSIGNKLFESDDEAAERIKAHLEEQNLGIDKLNVGFASGTVALSGYGDDHDSVRKAILIAGNVKGVERVVNQIVVPNTQDLESPDIEYYIIESGDTLSKIAKRYYGDAMAYPRIFEANREVIQDPDKIFVGQKIQIPLDT